MWNTAPTFSNKNHRLQEKNFIDENLFFSVEIFYVKVTEVHIVYIWRHTQSE